MDPTSEKRAREILESKLDSTGTLPFKHEISGPILSSEAPGGPAVVTASVRPAALVRRKNKSAVPWERPILTFSKPRSIIAAAHAKRGEIGQPVNSRWPIRAVTKSPVSAW